MQTRAQMVECSTKESVCALQTSTETHVNMLTAKTEDSSQPR